MPKGCEYRYMKFDSHFLIVAVFDPQIAYEVISIVTHSYNRVPLKDLQILRMRGNEYAGKHNE